MTRVFTASLVVLLATSAAWAQDSPVVNRLDTHPDWLFQPDRGWVSPPDTLDPWRYYPLAVGNAWEYQYQTGENFRVDIPRDSLIDEDVFYLMERVWYNPQGAIVLDYNVYVRFDTTSSYVLSSDPFPHNSYYGGAPCRFDAQPNAKLECEGLTLGVVDWMSYEGVLEFSDTTIVNVAVKQYNMIYGMWRYAADFGEVWGWTKDGRPARGLTFARIDGQEFGTELYPYTVSNESEPPYTKGVAIETLWPNPARSLISLQLRLSEAGQVHVSVLDLLGREVLTWEGTIADLEGRIELDVRSLATGSYIVRMHTANDISRGVLFTRVE